MSFIPSLSSRRSWAALGVTLIVLAGCGGAAGSSTSSSTASGDATTDAFRSCLKDHGLDLPDGASGQFPAGGAPQSGQPPQLPAGVDQSKLQEAMQACQDKAPAGGFGGQANSQAFQAYTSCLRDHGVNVPDPSSTASGSAATPPTFDRNDPNFAAANETCQALLPATSTPSTTASS